MTNDALLPCPFCGGPVDIEEVQPTYSPEFGKRRWWGIQCRNTLNRGGTCALQIVPQASAEAATERWNTRAYKQAQADAPALATMRGALEEALDREYNPFEPDNQSERYKRWKRALSGAVAAPREPSGIDDGFSACARCGSLVAPAPIASAVADETASDELLTALDSMARATLSRMNKVPLLSPKRKRLAAEHHALRQAYEILAGPTPDKADGGTV